MLPKVDYVLITSLFVCIKSFWIANDINDPAFGLAKASKFGFCEGREQKKSVMSLTVSDDRDIIPPMYEVIARNGTVWQRMVLIFFLKCTLKWRDVYGTDKCKKPYVLLRREL